MRKHEPFSRLCVTIAWGVVALTWISGCGRSDAPTEPVQTLLVHPTTAPASNIDYSQIQSLAWYDGAFNQGFHSVTITPTAECTVADGHKRISFTISEDQWREIQQLLQKINAADLAGYFEDSRVYDPYMILEFTWPGGKKNIQCSGWYSKQIGEISKHMDAAFFRKYQAELKASKDWYELSESMPPDYLLEQSK